MLLQTMMNPPLRSLFICRNHARYFRSVQALRYTSHRRFHAEGHLTNKVDVAAIRKNLDSMFQKYVESGLLAGAVCDVRLNGEVLYQRASGYLNLEEKRPVEVDSLFKILSMTKPLTAAMILHLEDLGLLGLDDPLHKHLPGFRDLKVTRAGSLEAAEWKPVEQEVTIRHLLLHTAGFTYSFLGRTPLHRKYEDLGIHARAGDGQNPPGSLAEVMRRLATLPLLQQPGSQWSYGVGYDILGAVVEAITGQSLGAAMENALFRPLEMNDTGFAIASFLETREERIATTYTPTTDGGTALMASGGGAAYAAGDVHYGGGGLASTAGDYHNFLSMLLAGGTFGGREILSPRAVRVMLEPLAASVPVRGGLALSFRQLGGYSPSPGGSVLTNPAASGAPGRAGEFMLEGSESTHCFCNPGQGPDAGLAVVWLTQLRPLNTHPLLRDLKLAVYGHDGTIKPAAHIPTPTAPPRRPRPT